MTDTVEWFTYCKMEYILKQLLNYHNYTTDTTQINTKTGYQNIFLYCFKR
jgi:hypothetical protein